MVNSIYFETSNLNGTVVIKLYLRPVEVGVADDA